MILSETPSGWSVCSIEGRPADRYEPTTRRTDGLTLIYLHGVHQQRLADHPAFAAEFERHGLPVLCPWTKESWWTDRIHAPFDLQLSAERYLLDVVLPWWESQTGSRSPRIGLFGTSMGGQGALRFAFKHPNRFPVAAGISPAVDYWWRMKDDYGDSLWQMYDEPEQARQDSATLHIHPLNWPRNIWFCCDPADYRWHESTDRLRSKLGALGIPYQCDLETSGGGHSFEYYSRMAPAAINFLVERLLAEVRRL